ncbi:DUF6020 family protein [Acetatifactor aquisgranensis]|uniref:DUF6020 family protein n=1 Tax=Acetatifactor aquisgranensis TaxID=2941233 RepID=UPI00203AAD93|nr:DUF6020 family protein [Acetatifactor aquisgranensis]
MDTKKWWKDKNVWLRYVMAFLGTCGVCYLGSIAGMEHASFSIMSVPVMILLTRLLAWTEKQLKETEDKRQLGRRVKYAAIVSFLFSVTMIAGYQLQSFGMTGLGVRGKALVLLRSASLSVAVFPFANIFFTVVEKIPSGSPLQGQQAGRKAWKVFGISTAAIFLCLIPVWLAYYPAIMSYDFHRQIGEASKGFAWFWPYQPIAHTWVIWLFLQVGYACGNLQTGMACMALFQMLVYSLVTGYACAFLYRILRKRWAVVAGILFFGVFPLNSVLVLCATKDILFGTLFLLFILLMAECFFFSEGKRQAVMAVFLLLEGSLMMQFRNNCIYAVAVFGVLWALAAAKREKLKVILLCVLLVAGGKGTGMAIKAAIGTELEIAKVEMYSVPIQQFARVGYYHGGELDDETWQLLNRYVPQECWEDYYPPISDGIKGIVAVTTFYENWDGHLGQLLTDWIQLGIRYPNEYIDAFLELTRGYWFLDDRSYAECLGYGTEGRLGTIYTHNIAFFDDGSEIRHESKFPWLEAQLEKIVSGNTYYNWPVISLLFRSAFYLWALLLIWIVFLYRRQKRQAVFCLFPLLYMGTMLLGPVVQMRYVFPIMLSLPVLAGLLMISEE